KAIEYEEYLKRIGEVARKVQAGQADDTPEPLKNSPALRALYNYLVKGDGMAAASSDSALERAQTIDAEVRRVRPDGWRGVETRERVIQAALFEILQDEAEVERIFAIIEAQKEY
ncbi:MAG TPA: restriction endonuclease subunit R, partial [Thermoanaerobaculia bacterium]|nr:restriction endonuclease subunit R [Thermoanaerobaculia bacterium]